MIRFTPEQRQSHVEGWRNSGKSKAEYCRESGLPYHRLVAWTQSPKSLPAEVQDRDCVAENTSGFVVMNLKRDANVPDALLVQFGSRCALRFSISASPGWVAGVLRELCVC